MTSIASIGILGAGGASHALGRAILARIPGCEVWVWSRREQRARAAVQLLGTGATACRLEQVAQAQVVVLAVSDPAIGQLAEELAGCARLESATRPVALHLAGALGLEPLEPLAQAGWETGVMHPLLSLQFDTPVELWAGALCTISGAQHARESAQALVHELGAQGLVLAADQRLRYHAAAALLAQGAVALIHATRAEFVELGIEPRRARQGLAGLLASVAANLQFREPREALSGPIDRGDWDTVEAHRCVAGPMARELQDLVRKTLEGLLAEG